MNKSSVICIISGLIVIWGMIILVIYEPISIQLTSDKVKATIIEVGEIKTDIVITDRNDYNLIITQDLTFKYNLDEKEYQLTCKDCELENNYYGVYPTDELQEFLSTEAGYLVNDIETIYVSDNELKYIADFNKNGDNAFILGMILVGVTITIVLIKMWIIDASKVEEI